MTRPIEVIEAELRGAKRAKMAALVFATTRGGKEYVDARDTAYRQVLALEGELRQAKEIEAALAAAERTRLRDQFAGQALQSLVFTPHREIDDIARDAYRIADAMLKARKAQP